MSRILIGNEATKEGAPIELDVDRLIVSRLLVQANSGGGKSFALRRLLEQTFQLVPQVVIDVDEEFLTLREKFPYVLAGAGVGADCRADPRTAQLLARRILEHGFSCIVSIYELKKQDRLRFVRLFLEALLEAPRNLWRPLLVVVDEAHMFCPENGQAESADAVKDLMSRGRKRGYCGVLATQRISKLAKDAAAEANNKLIGRATLDIDVKRAAEELGFTARDQRWDLMTLEPGFFYTYGPAISPRIRMVKVGPVKTTHLEPGQRRAAAAPPPPEKLKAILAKLADLPKDAEAAEGELERLRRENADLRRKSAAAAPAGPDQAVIDMERAAAARSGYREGYGAALEAVRPIADRLGTLRDALRETVDAFLGDLKRVKPAPVPARTGQTAPPAAAPRAAAARPAARPASGDSALQGPQQRILDALAWLDSVRPGQPADRIQLALLAGYSPNSSGYHNNLGSLRTAGLIDYPQSGQVLLTDEGHGAARAPAAAPTTEELHRTLRDKLPAPQWRILETLIRIHPDAIGRAELAGDVGYSPDSSGFHNNLGALRSLGFIDYPRQGSVVALPCLFLEDK